MENSAAAAALILVYITPVVSLIGVVLSIIMLKIFTSNDFKDISFKYIKYQTLFSLFNLMIKIDTESIEFASTALVIYVTNCVSFFIFYFSNEKFKSNFYKTLRLIGKIFSRLYNSSIINFCELNNKYFCCYGSKN